MKTEPPTFASALEPLHADNWLRSISHKLDIAQCTDQEKVLYATYRLENPAASWWESYKRMFTANQEITFALNEGYVQPKVLLVLPTPSELFR